jgi:hypothetical protein
MDKRTRERRPLIRAAIGWVSKLLLKMLDWGSVPAPIRAPRERMPSSPVCSDGQVFRPLNACVESSTDFGFSDPSAQKEPVL